MQDAFSSAEALRVPTVAFIGQRGGLSTSTVIYSQEEVTMTCFGGNGEGFRIVYSVAGLQDLYDYGIKAFSSAWKYMFPTFVLYDGYQAKMLTEVNIDDPIPSSLYPSKPILLNPDQKEAVNMRNCYNMEEEINEVILSYQKDFDAIVDEVSEYDEGNLADADIVLLCHGVVTLAVKTAVRELRDKGVKVGYFRPVTLRPLPVKRLREVAKDAKEFLIIESAQGQFSRLIKDVIYDIGTPIGEMFRPAIGITPEEIIEEVLKK
jgi:2-oxoglutarate ferredoxin oxidoreductase subunit alpha